MPYEVKRPVLKRYLAEREDIRAAISYCHGLFLEAGVPEYAIATSAGVPTDIIKTYVKHAYRDYATDEDNYRLSDPDNPKSKMIPKNNRRYITDEGILRLCDYFGIKVVMTVELKPKMYELPGETLARIAEEKWKYNTHRNIGQERAMPNRKYVG